MEERQITRFFEGLNHPVDFIKDPTMVEFIKDDAAISELKTHWLAWKNSKNNASMYDKKNTPCQS